MAVHRVVFCSSSSRTASVSVPHGTIISEAARQAGEPLSVECGGRGACGRCVVAVQEGTVPDYRVLRREEGVPLVLACQVPVLEPLTVRPLGKTKLPRLQARQAVEGIEPLREWAPYSLALDPVADVSSDNDLGVALDIGTTTLRLLLIRLADGVVVGGCSRYNPQIPLGADVVTRIVAAERGRLCELAGAVRAAVAEMVASAAEASSADPAHICHYVVAGNLTMVHLLLGANPSQVRQIPPVDLQLAFAPVTAASLEWPGRVAAQVQTLPAAGAWVGGDIVAGAVRAGFSRSEQICLYVDLGTNGEVALGAADFALTCACSAGPAFEGGGIRCGMRADRGAIDGAVVDAVGETLVPSIIRGGRVRGICGSGLIALTDALFRAGWIDRSARFTDRLPEHYRHAGAWGTALSLSPDGSIALWERDLASLVRSKAAIFAGIRTLLASLGIGAAEVEQVVVSGNFGRFLNLPAAVGIGLLLDLPLERYAYVDNGSLEGASLVLLSRQLGQELGAYLSRITYVDLAQLDGYMDELVGASFLPHTDPAVLSV